MKQKKSILAVIFSLIFSVFFLSGQLFAYKEADLEKISHAPSRPYKCPNCDLSKAELEDRFFRGANLSGANLSDADLTKSNLSEADLSDADLSLSLIHI